MQNVLLSVFERVRLYQVQQRSWDTYCSLISTVISMYCTWYSTLV